MSLKFNSCYQVSAPLPDQNCLHTKPEGATPRNRNTATPWRRETHVAAATRTASNEAHQQAIQKPENPSIPATTQP